MSIQTDQKAVAVRDRSGKFAKKTSALYKFCQRTGLTAEHYYKWASECGQRASHAYKDSLLCAKFGFERIQELYLYKPLDCGLYENLGQLHDFILGNSENPAELAACYLELLSLQDNDHSIDGEINRYLMPFPKASFERFGDKNWLLDISPSWLSAKGIPIDVQAMNISETAGKEITEANIVEFVRSYRKGKYKPKTQLRIEQYKARLDILCGFEVSVKYAEHLASVLNEPAAVEPILEETDDLPF